MEKYIYVDQKGYEQMVKKIEKLKQDLVDNSKVKGEAASGDAGNSTHDNFDFEQAKQKELMIISEIERTYRNLERVKIIEKTGDNSIIDIDDYITVEIDFEGDIEQMDLQLIGGSVETPESQNVVSMNSPLGRAIYKKKVGDITSYKVGDVNVFVKILKKYSNNQSCELDTNTRKL